jgi:lipopolysaccharide export LptBFGC system permease protein LptF
MATLGIWIYLVAFMLVPASLVLFSGRGSRRVRIVWGIVSLVFSWLAVVLFLIVERPRGPAAQP